MTQPNPLAVVDEHLDRRFAPIAKYENRSAEWIRFQHRAALGRQTIDPSSEVGRLHRDENPRQRGKLHHRVFSKKACVSATTSAFAPTASIRIFCPRAHKSSITVFLCGHAGIEPATIENSAAYLTGWLKALRGDSLLVVQAAAQAQKAADLVLGREFAEADQDVSDKSAEYPR